MKPSNSQFQFLRLLKNQQGFTLLELLVVMGIIMAIAGITFAISSFVHTKAAQARTQADLDSIATALENYKSEMGEYPQLTYPPGVLPSSKVIVPIISVPTELGGNPASTNFNFLMLALCPPPVINSPSQPGTAYSNYVNIYNPSKKIFFTPNKSMIAQTTNVLNYDQTLDPYESFLDAFGNAICYRCPAVMNPSNSYDLWSSAGMTNTNGWIKNW